MNAKPWWVYIIQTESGKLYTGITNNLDRRFEEHQSHKKGARFFHLDKAEKMVFSENHDNRSLASKRECAIKKMTRSQKLALIQSLDQI
jgi:putative endonuclease